MMFPPCLNHSVRRSLVCLAFLLAALIAAPFAAAQTAPSTPMPAAEQQQLANEVKQETLHAWEGYRRYAWGHDALKPLSKQPFDWYGKGHSLLMTPVDAMDTLMLMGLTQQAGDARRLVDEKLNFDQDIYVKDFEINIRLVGGLLSDYELSGDPKLLHLAEDLARRMMPMYNSPTGMPYEYVNLRTGAVRGKVSNPAEVGSMLIEYGMLSKLTGKQEYYDKAKRAVVALYQRQSKIGLVGNGINVETGEWTGTTAGIMGGIDSYYEYLLKAAVLFHDEDCERMWTASFTAIQKYLADQRPDGLWYGQADMNTGARTTTHYGALDAFFPAVMVLWDEYAAAQSCAQMDAEYGGPGRCTVHHSDSPEAALQDSSYRMWQFAGIEPDGFDYVARQITAPSYPLRPEIIESTYYLYHYTHDPKYLQMGKTFFDSLKQYCRTPDAYAELSDVRTKQKKDEMESFFFAETLKYLYLLFSPPETLDFNRIVFNTEAHPLLRAAALSTDPKAAAAMRTQASH